MEGVLKWDCNGKIVIESCITQLFVWLKILYNLTLVPAKQVPNAPSNVHNTADSSCKSIRENSVNLILLLIYSVFNN